MSTTNQVVVMPFPRIGQINPLVNLCHLLSASSGPTTRYTVFVTDEWHQIFGADPKLENIVFTIIPYVLPSELDPSGDGENANFFSSVQSEMAKQFDRLLDTMNLAVKFIVADLTLGGDTFHLATRRDIPVAAYWPMSASAFIYMHYIFHRHSDRPVTFYDGLDREYAVVKEIYGLPPTCLKDLPRMVHMPPFISLLRGRLGANCVKCLLFANIYELPLEGETVNQIVAITSLPVYVLGPNIPHFQIQTSLPSSESSYFSWLESKLPRSVLYISLGSLERVSNNQIAEILAGLKQSGVTLLWAAGCEASRLSGDHGSEGLVVERCDQLRVLSHSSVGGFLSHCGWNSTKESLYSGVPLLNFPIRGDQVLNSKLVDEDWKTGWKLKTYNTFLKREVVQDDVRKFMSLEGSCSKKQKTSLEGDSRKSMMKHVNHVRDICHKTMEEGGCVDIEIGCFLKDSETNWLLPTHNPLARNFATSALVSAAEELPHIGEPPGIHHSVPDDYLF